MANVDIHEVIQKLEPGDKVKLVEVDCTEFGGDILRFHNYENPYTPAELLVFQQQGVDVIPPKPIIWKGQRYECWPYIMQGVEMDGSGGTPSPSLQVANIDGSISSLCLLLRDLFLAKVTETTTFEQYLDGGSDADPEMAFTQTWYISRKSGENEVSVTFQLSSPADLTGQKLPRRQIYSMCHWALNNGYRGPDCGYTGDAFFTDKGEPTDDPTKDVCGGLCRDCKLRFGEDNQLPFGGFIASSLIS